jgi:DNA-binding CsgD family transcriptional regulator
MVLESGPPCHGSPLESERARFHLELGALLEGDAGLDVDPANTGQVELLCIQLKRRLRARSILPKQIARACILLSEMEGLLYSHSLIENENAPDLGSLRDSIFEQSASNLSEWAGAASTQLCMTLGFSKALISLVSGTTWVPLSLFVHPTLSGSFDDLQGFVRNNKFTLSEAPREADMARRRMPYLVHAVEINDKTFRPIVVLSKPSGFVATPIVVKNETVAFIHADRHMHGVTAEDLVKLQAFSEFTALSYQKGEILRSLDAQPRWASDPLDSLGQGAECQTDEVSGAGPENNRLDGAFRDRWDLSPGASLLPQALTLRQHDVLLCLSKGMTNAEIARALFITEGTVKTHVKQILRRLNARTRAEAAATFRQACQQVPEAI